jgi:hypothetical protein
VILLLKKNAWSIWWSTSPIVLALWAGCTLLWVSFWHGAISIPILIAVGVPVGFYLLSFPFVVWLNGLSKSDTAQVERTYLWLGLFRFILISVIGALAHFCRVVVVIVLNALHLFYVADGGIVARTIIYFVVLVACSVTAFCFYRKATQKFCTKAK